MIPKCHLLQKVNQSLPDGIKIGGGDIQNQNRPKALNPDGLIRMAENGDIIIRITITIYPIGIITRGLHGILLGKISILNKLSLIGVIFVQMKFDVYNGDYNLTLRIECDNIYSLYALKNELHLLSCGCFTSVEFEMKYSKARVTSLTLLCNETNEIDLDYNGKQINVTWNETNDGWWHIEGLIDGLIKSALSGETHGFQYIERYKNIVVEICYILHMNKEV